MGRKRIVEEELTEVQLAESALMGALEGSFEYVEGGGGNYYDEGARIEVSSKYIVEHLREAVKCWVREVMEEREEEKKS